MLRLVYLMMAVLCTAVMACSCGTMENEAETKLTEEVPYVSYEASPRIYAGDYDGDGLKEYALVQMIGDGTGVYEEQLYILEKDGTDLDIVTWDNGLLLDEVSNRISSEASPDGGSLQLYADGKPLCGIALDAGKKYEGFYLDEQIRIRVNETLGNPVTVGGADSTAYSLELVILPGIAYEGARTLFYECSPEIVIGLVYGNDRLIATGEINVSVISQ